MNSRQIAIVAWSMAAIMVALFQPKFRRSVLDLIKAFTTPQALSMGASSALWNAAVVWMLWKAGLWSPALWFDTASFVLVGTISLVFQLNDDRKYEWRAFLRVAALAFGVSVALEAFVYNYTFSLLVELMLVPWTVFWGVVRVSAESTPEYAVIHRIASRLLVVTGTVMIIGSVLGAWHDPNLMSLATLGWLLLPFLLTACYLPYLAMLRIGMAYQQACSPLRLDPAKPWSLRAYVTLRYLLRFGFNLAALSEFWHERYMGLRQAANRGAVDELF